MVKAIRTDKTPHLILVQYTTQWCIQNVLLVPRTFITESVIEKRRPLSDSARRRGWVGCNILLSGVPEDGKIPIVSAGVAQPERRVREEFERVRGLAQLPPSLRGWTVDVLNTIRRLGRAQFSLRELYSAESELRAAHPRNQNVRPKIRQQLRVLRDMGLLDFIGHGTYRLRAFEDFNRSKAGV